MPILGVLWLSCLVLSPVVLPLTALVDALTRRRFATLRLCCFVCWYLTCEVFGVLAAFLIWLRSGGPFISNWQAFEARNFTLQRHWGTTLARGGMWLYGLRIEATWNGEPLAQGSPPPPLIVLMRHASLMDTVLGLLVISAPHRLRLRYVLKRTLLLDPCLDIVGNRIPNWFVERGAHSNLDIAEIAQLLDGCDRGDGVLIYPEGMRFTAARRARVLESLQTKDPSLWEYARHLEHVLPPRRGGTLALLRLNLKRQPQAEVLICSHTGFEGSATLGQILRGDLINRVIRMQLTRIPSTQLPSREADLEPWLMEQWRRVDAYVASSSVV